MSSETNIKLGRIRGLMEQKKLDGILLTRDVNYHWVTGGRNDTVDKGSGDSASKILILKDAAYAICNSSEQYRVFDEELTDGTFELIAYPWHDSEFDAIRPYIHGKKIGSDNGIYSTENISIEIQRLRYVLTPEEEARMDEIGPETARILENTMRSIHPGETEWEISGRVTGKLMEKGYTVPVCLVGSDERLIKYRHPLPTFKKVEKMVMVAICAQKYGLTSSISRIVSFSALPDDINKKYNTLLKIDATYILNTRAGELSRDILKKAYNIYKETGYEKDFHLHHQGGALGYLTRDYCTNFDTEDRVLDHQGYSWNPTIAGVKIEDTYVIKGNTQDIITYSGDWVYRDVTINGQTIRRPDILIQKI